MASMSHEGVGLPMTPLEQAGRPPADKRARVDVFPRIVTVSREFGAGGSRIASRLAAELGFQLWDHELTVHLARKADADVNLVRAIDERGRDLIDEVVSTSLALGVRPFSTVWGPSQTRVTGSQFRALLTRTVAELAERGGAVVVGRGANFLVEPDQALRVRVVCPLQQRIERYARVSQSDWTTAERHVCGKDRERERFVRQLCAEDGADPAHYDLVVNTRDLSEAAAAKLVLGAYRARFGVQAQERSHTSAATAAT